MRSSDAAHVGVQFLSGRHVVELNVDGAKPNHPMIANRVRYRPDGKQWVNGHRRVPVYRSVGKYRRSVVHRFDPAGADKEARIPDLGAFPMGRRDRTRGIEHPCRRLNVLDTTGL